MAIFSIVAIHYRHERADARGDDETIYCSQDNLTAGISRLENRGYEICRVESLEWKGDITSDNLALWLNININYDNYGNII